MFDQKYAEWISSNLQQEENPRRHELLEREILITCIRNGKYVISATVTGILILLMCRVVQKAGLKSKGTVPTRETLMSGDLRIYACGIACWLLMDGCFCLSPTFPSKRNRNNASSSYSPSSANFFRPMCRPSLIGRKRKRCVMRVVCCVPFSHPNLHSTCASPIAILAAFCTVW